MAKAKSYLELVKAVDNFPHIDIASTPYSDDEASSFYQLLLPDDPRPHGYIMPSIARKMPWTSDFRVQHDTPRTVQLLDSSNGKDTSTACNRAIAEVLSKSMELKTFALLSKPHKEDYKIIGAKYSAPVQMLRTAAPLFGISCRGAHMTAYVNTDEGIKIWVPRRSKHLFTYPGMLDTSVAGGIRAEESPYECIVHEAAEEASLPEDLVRKRTQPCGAITYVAQSGAGDYALRSKSIGDVECGMMVPDVLYVFDMELPADIVPKPCDDEVEQFYLWDVDRVKAAMMNCEFKTNCASVMIDFFIRHGIITDENEPEYLEIINRLHRVLPVPTSPTGT